MEIQRLHMLDVEINADTAEGALEIAADLATGLLLTREVVVDPTYVGPSDREPATVRFGGPRKSLEEVLIRILQANPERLRPNETVGQYALRLTGADS